MNDGDLPESFVEARKLGCVSSSDWQSYTWKNELSEQRRRILQHLDEVFADSNTESNPLHMLERAIGVAAICMRRLIECRLVTDRFRDSQLDVHEISVKADVEWREPFLSRTASEIFNNYDMRARHPERRTPKVIADKMLHARVIAVLYESAYLPDGLLVASDTQSLVSFISHPQKLPRFSTHFSLITCNSCRTASSTLTSTGRLRSSQSAPRTPPHVARVAFTGLPASFRCGLPE
jgi:hypothetical protein